jgi:type I restriction enzyme S subunit
MYQKFVQEFAVGKMTRGSGILPLQKKYATKRLEAASPRRKHDMISSMKQRIAQIRHGQVPKGYRLTQCGVLPSDWTELSFGDIYAERNEPGNESLPLLMVSIHSGVSDGEVDEKQLPKKVKRIADKTQYKRATPGDLVFNMMRAWQGAIGTARTGGMVSPAYIVSEPNDKVDPLFMDYYVKMERTIQYIHRQSYGVTDFRLRLYWDSFVAIPCVLPPLAEQRKIAKILATQDKVIELKEKRLAEKQKQKKYLMQQLLTGKKRLNGFSGEWEVKCLCDACYLVTKCTTGELCDYVSTENMAAELKNNVCFEDSQQERQGIEFVKGDILIANIRPYLKKVWKATKCGVCSADVLVLRPTSVSSEFLYRLIANDDFFSYVMIAAKGSKMPRGDKKHIMSMPITLPISEKEQMAISKFMNTVDNELELFVDELTHEKQKKKALMQLLLTGIVRVKEAAGSRFSTQMKERT